MSEIERKSHEESRRFILRFLIVVWALNMPFLIATSIAEFGTQSPLAQILRLTSENNAGAWWSGMQLLMFGLICLSASGELPKTLGEMKRPLMVLGLAGLCLSADEMGSIHERVSEFGKENFGSGKLALLPFAIIGGGAVGYSVLALFRARASVGNVWLCVCIGFGLFGLVWVQEHIEHAVSFIRPEAKAFRADLEEGSEFVGFSFLLIGSLLLRSRLGRQRSVSSALLPNQFALRVVSLLLLMAIIPVILVRLPFSRAELDIPASGNFGITIPVLLFAISALISVQLSRMCRKERNRWLIVGVTLAGTSLATLVSYPDPFTLPATLGGRTIAWRADWDMFFAIPLLAISGFLLPGLNRIRFAVSVVVVQLLIIALILSRKEWADVIAPYLVSVPVVLYLMRCFKSASVALPDDPIAPPEIGADTEFSFAGRARADGNPVGEIS
jgi:hypothetical protein